MKVLSLLAVLMLALGGGPWALAQETPKKITDDDSFQKTLQRIQQLLNEHYRPMIPVANYHPFVKANFEPKPFNSCTLNYKLSAVLAKGSSYVLNVSMNLADLDPAAIDISRDLKRDDRWFISFRTLNNAPKIRVSYRHAIGAAVTAGSNLSPQNAFDTDGRDNAQQIADLFESTIRYCSKKH